MALYPPILASSREAFLATDSVVPLDFTLSNLTNESEIGNIQVRIVYQSNNKTAVNVDKYPDGVVYRKYNDVVNHSVVITQSDIEGGWQPNRYYKVQMRFGSTKTLWSDEGVKFAVWRANQAGHLSEWSTVMVIKALDQPDVKIANQGAAMSGSGDVVVESAVNTELTTTPLFQGSLSIDGEIENKYKFDLADKDNVLIETSGWLQHDSSGGLDSYRFKTVLQDETEYVVGYRATTMNNYEAVAEDYRFTVHESFLTRLDNISIKVRSTLPIGEPYGNENGCLGIYLTTVGPISGNYIITRSDERSNYTVWEDLKYLLYSDKTLNDSLVYNDFTIESGIKYKYAIQQENRSGLRTGARYEGETNEDSPYHYVDFQYSYLYCDGVQLKMRFDNTMNTFKHSVLMQKQDTLGSKYPTINRNGDAYYAEFPINGLISLHMDDYQTFFEKRNDGYYYKGEKVITDDKYKEVLGVEDYSETFNHNLTDNNLFIERIYRQKVEEFLNDGGYKLYKSPTEGNIVVTLTNIQLQPNAVLGRMIFAFTSTAYEVLDNTLYNLNEYGIIDRGEFKASIIDEDEQVILVGQVSGLFNTTDDIVALIREESGYNIGGGYQYVLDRLRSIQIEPYPKISFQPQINELQAKIVQAKTDNDSDLLAQLQKELEDVQTLNVAVNGEKLSYGRLQSITKGGLISSPVVTVIVNGTKELSLGMNRVYNVDGAEDITSMSLKYPGPIMVNYSCYMTSQESKKTTISQIITTSVWGQLAGVYTTNTHILDNYSLARRDGLVGKTLFFADEEGPLNATENTGVFTPNYLRFNFSIYQSLDITEVIKEQVRHQIEKSHNTTFYYDKEERQWTDGEIQYVFEKFNEITIEADQGTRLIITNRDNTSQEVDIGYTCLYKLKNLDQLGIASIALANPSYAVVNYRCMTMQTILGGE